MRPEHRIFVGVVAPIDPRIESLEEVRDRVLEAANYIPIEQLGTTDDCGFAPFADDLSTSRQQLESWSGEASKVPIMKAAEPVPRTHPYSKPGRPLRVPEADPSASASAKMVIGASAAACRRLIPSKIQNPCAAR
jgi:hypothetical protein